LPVLISLSKYIWNYSLKGKRECDILREKCHIPSVNHRNEIMVGSSTIRAFGTEDHAFSIELENQNVKIVTFQVS